MDTIKCKCGRDILVDDDIYFIAMTKSWNCGNGVIVSKPRGNKKPTYLARLVINVPPGFVPDHINHDIHDNRRVNLRIATRSQNSGNTLRHKDNCGYKGVSEDKVNQMHYSRIFCKGVKYWLGRFKTAKEAALAYDAAAVHFFGEFAVTNYSLGLLSEKPGVYVPKDALDQLMKAI